MNAVGLIFSNIHDNNIPEMTRLRTMASVPFACRYRLIDFALSNMVNADIRKVGIITHYNYQSLLDHVGSGKDWDLARRNGGVKILPPFITAYESGTENLRPYSTRLEALQGITQFISHTSEDYVVLSDCDAPINIDIKDIIDQHIRTNSDITVAVKRVLLSEDDLKRHTVIVSDSDGNILKAQKKGIYPSDECDVSLNIMVVTRTYLEAIVRNSISVGYKSFADDILSKKSENAVYKIYRYDGYYNPIDSLSGYLACNMDLLNKSSLDQLFNVKNRPIFTKVRNSSPTFYSKSSSVSNSLIADGCTIKGRVENSVIFRGVTIEEGAYVKNSVLLQDTYVGKDAALNCVIADKNVVIKEGRTLSGHQTRPFYLDKGSVI